MDFKGVVAGPGRARVEPLSVRGEHSRMILEPRAVPDADGDGAGPLRGVVPDGTGCPGAIRSDNGPPLPAPRGCRD